MNPTVVLRGSMTWMGIRSSFLAAGVRKALRGFCAKASTGSRSDGEFPTAYHRGLFFEISSSKRGRSIAPEISSLPMAEGGRRLHTNGVSEPLVLRQNRSTSWELISDFSFARSSPSRRPMS